MKFKSPTFVLFLLKGWSPLNPSQIFNTGQGLMITLLVLVTLSMVLQVPLLQPTI